MQLQFHTSGADVVGNENMQLVFLTSDKVATQGANLVERLVGFLCPFHLNRVRSKNNAVHILSFVPSAGHSNGILGL